MCATRRVAPGRVNDYPARLLANPRLSLLEAAMSDRRSRSESLSTAPVGTKLAAFASIGKPVEKPALTHIQSKWKPLATSATIGNYARHHCPRRHRHHVPHPRRRHPRLLHHSSSLHRHPHTSTLTAASVDPSPSPPPPSPPLPSPPLPSPPPSSPPQATGLRQERGWSPGRTLRHGPALTPSTASTTDLLLATENS